MWFVPFPRRRSDENQPYFFHDIRRLQHRRHQSRTESTVKTSFADEHRRNQEVGAPVALLVATGLV